MTATVLPETTSHFRRLKSGLVVPKTTGKRTFVTERSLFPGHFDQDWIEYATDVKSRPKPECKGDLYEQTQDGKIKELIKSFSIDPKLLMWTQDQALAFIQAHPEYFGDSDPSVLFPLEGQFVAFVYRRDGELKAYVFRFDDDGVWIAEHRGRWVLPQLEG